MPLLPLLLWVLQPLLSLLPLPPTMVIRTTPLLLHLLTLVHITLYICPPSFTFAPPTCC